MHVLAPLSYATPALAGVVAPVIIIAVLWELVLKGFGLWHAARGSQKWWFLAMLVFNTLGILPIVYLIWFRPKTSEVHAAAPADSSEAQ